MKFNLTRFINLLKRDFITHKKSIIFTCLGVWGFIALLLGINYFDHNPSYQYADFWLPLFLGLLFIAGLTFTALIFKEFKTPGGRLQFLSLPASNLEKVASRWLYTLILFPLFVLITIWLLSSMFMIEGQELFSDLRGREGTQAMFLGYLILHANTFLLTLYFNKLVPFKVTIASVIITMLVGLVAGLLLLLFFGSYFEFGQGFIKGEEMTMSRQGQEFFEYNLFPKLLFIAKFFIAPFLWVVSYFKMKEKEA